MRKKIISSIAFLIIALLPLGAFSMTGGPDANGYKYYDSNESNASPFEWIDVTNSGEPLYFANDSVSNSITLGFTFNFYGKNYNRVYASSNGYITFDQESNTGCCNGQDMPTNYVPNNLIAALWDDLNPGV